MKVKVVAYKNHLVMIPQEPEKGIGKGWYPTGSEDRLGCVLTDSKKNLGISKQALQIMQQVKRNQDAVGDLGWWRCDNGKYAFSWWGALYRIIDLKAEGARDFQVHSDQCTVIRNTVPKAAKLAIDANLERSEKKKHYHWALPLQIEDKP